MYVEMTCLSDCSFSTYLFHLGTRVKVRRKVVMYRFIFLFKSGTFT